MPEKSFKLQDDVENTKVTMEETEKQVHIKLILSFFNSKTQKAWQQIEKSISFEENPIQDEEEEDDNDDEYIYT